MGLFDSLVKGSARSLIKRQLKNAAQNELKDLSRLRISDVTRKGWLPTQWKSTQQEAIRQARALRSQMSKAELNWMQAHPEAATKIYKSGVREFGGQANKEALQKARQEVIKPFISQNASKTRRNRALGALGLAGLATAGYNFEPVNFYVHDLYKGAKNKIGLDSKSTIRTEKDMSDNFNNQIQELAALAIASGQNGLAPWVYQVYNKSHGREAKYADFSNPIKFLNPGQRVEYSNGGMSMSQSRNKNGYDVILTDEAAWDPDEGTSYSKLSPRGLPVTLGVTRKNLGDNIDKMRYQYNIPSEKVDSMRNVYNKYSEIIRKEREQKEKNKV